MSKTSYTNGQEEDAAVFHARFWRCHRVLHFLACRVLGGPEHADDAVENCWLTASQTPSRFENDGAFRGWLVRILIDEALAIRHNSIMEPTIICNGSPSRSNGQPGVEGAFELIQASGD